MRLAAYLLVATLLGCEESTLDVPDDGVVDAAVVVDGNVVDAHGLEASVADAQSPAKPWAVTPNPIYGGQYNAVGDPSVVQVADGTYQMFHHCIDVERIPQGSEICLATSSDGIAWASAATVESTPLVLGRLLRTTAGTWQEAHETPFARVEAGVTSLYFIGYRGASFGAMPPNGVGRVTSANPLQFPSIADTPAFAPTATGADAFGITSPSIAVTDGAVQVMYYTGWCAPPFTCPQLGLSLLAATSVDGIAWARHDGVVVGDPGLAWTNGGISEAEVVRGPDGRYFLFFSSLSGAKGSPNATQRIGVAVANGPFGPFTFHSEPIVTPEPLGTWASGGVLAPAVRFEGSRVRMWMHGFEVDAAGDVNAARIGYAETSWPLDL